MCLPMSLYQNEYVFTSHIMFTLCPVKHKAHFSHFTILQILQFTIYFLFLLFFLQFCNFSLKTQVVAFCFPAPTQIFLILSFCCSCCCCYFFHFFKNTLHAIFVLFQRKFLLLLLFFSFLVVFNTFAYTLAATATKTIRYFSFKSLVQDLLIFVIFFVFVVLLLLSFAIFFSQFTFIWLFQFIFFCKSKITILQNYSIFCQRFVLFFFDVCTLHVLRLRVFFQCHRSIKSKIEGPRLKIKNVKDLGQDIRVIEKGLANN